MRAVRAAVPAAAVGVVVVRGVAVQRARGGVESGGGGGGEVQVELPEEQLRGDAGERVRDEEQRLEVAPREVQRDLAPDLVRDALFEVVCRERGEELRGSVGGWVGKG